MKERIANLVFLRNRLRARRDQLLGVPEAAELAESERLDAAVAQMRRPA